MVFARAGGRGFGGLGLVVGVSAGVPGSCVSGRSHCRVAAFGVCGLLVLAIFFITISHCAWRHVISLSKATKKRSKENAFRTRAHKLTQRAVSTFLAPQKHGARKSNGCVNPSFSRILTRTRFAPYALGQAQLPRKPARPYALLVLHRLVSWLLDPSSYFCWYGLTYSAASFLSGLATWFGMRTNRWVVVRG